MAKLAEVRARREAAAAKAAAEKEEEEAIEAERKELAARAGALRLEDNDEEDDKKKKTKKKDKKNNIPKLDKITIKRMKPAQMKTALKERGLEIQGNAKTLTERLLKYEAER